MAILSPSTLEDHPAGTINLGGIINDNWAKINKIFDPDLSVSDPLYGLIAQAVDAQGGGMTAYVQRVLNISPVGYWPLDENSGTSFGDASPGTANGTSTGTVTPNTSQVIIGSSSKAPQFVAASNGVITIPAGTDINFTPNADAFTVSVWFRVATNADYTVLSKTGSGTNRNFQLSISATANQFDLYFGGTANVIAAPGANLNNDTWHHIAVASNGTVGRVYYDGREIASVTPGSTAENAVDWLIGARRTGGENVNTGATSYLNGFAAHVALFDVALTAAQVGRLSNGRETQ